MKRRQDLPEVPIRFEELPIIPHVHMFAQAAAQLLLPNSAIILPETVGSHYGPITRSRQKLDALLYALNEARSGWMTTGPNSLSSTPATDRGMHSNRYVSGDPSPDCLHFHHTASGTGRVVLAAMRPEYYESDDIGAVNERLTKLLEAGKTDPRFADPDSFRHGELRRGVNVVFRRNGPSPDELPQLHAFVTTSEQRTGSFTPLYHIA